MLLERTNSQSFMKLSAKRYFLIENVLLAK